MLCKERLLNAYIVQICGFCRKKYQNKEFKFGKVMNSLKRNMEEAKAKK